MSSLLLPSSPPTSKPFVHRGSPVGHCRTPTWRLRYVECCSPGGTEVDIGNVHSKDFAAVPKHTNVAWEWDSSFSKLQLPCFQLQTILNGKSLSNDHRSKFGPALFSSFTVDCASDRAVLQPLTTSTFSSSTQYYTEECVATPSLRGQDARLQLWLWCILE